MALTDKTILELVKKELPFLDDSQETTDKVALSKMEQQYFLAKYTGFTGADIEDDSKYDGTLRLLLKQLVACDLLGNKSLENVAGKSGSAATGNRRVKKGKADVVEGEFEYLKASDGGFLGNTSQEFKDMICGKACTYASQLGYRLPMCNKKKGIPMPFKSYVDC